MSVFEYIIGGLIILASLVIIFVVLMQEGRQHNVGVISGAADTFLDKGAAKTWDMRMAKYTKVLAAVFFVLVLGGMLVTKYLGADAQKGSSSGSTSGSTTTTSSTVSGGSTTTNAGGSTTTTHNHDHEH